MKRTSSNYAHRYLLELHGAPRDDLVCGPNGDLVTLRPSAMINED